MHARCGGVWRRTAPKSRTVAAGSPATWPASSGDPILFSHSADAIHHDSILGITNPGKSRSEPSPTPNEANNAPLWFCPLFISSKEKVQITPLKYNQSLDNPLKYFLIQFTP